MIIKMFLWLTDGVQEIICSTDDNIVTVAVTLAVTVAVTLAVTVAVT